MQQSTAEWLNAQQQQQFLRQHRPNNAAGHSSSSISKYLLYQS
jgi:hypothetical protein